MNTAERVPVAPRPSAVRIRYQDGLLTRLRKRVYRTAWCYSRSIDTHEPCAAEPGAGLAIRPLGAADFDTYARLRPRLSRERFLARLARGDACYAVAGPEGLLAVTWVATQDAEVLSSLIPLQESELYLYNSYTQPEARGRRFHATLLEHILAEFRKRGARRALVFIETDNRAAMRSRERSGFRRCGTLRCLRLGRQRWHVELHDGGRRAVFHAGLARLEEEVARSGGLAELADWRSDRELLALVRECSEAQRRAAAKVFEQSFRPASNAREAVSEHALDSLLAEERLVHGIATQREISNVIPFNSRRVEDAVHDDELRRLRRRVDVKVVEKLRRAYADPHLRVAPSGHFWYPPGAFMGWHTNHLTPGFRLYISHAEDPGRSFFRYRRPDSGEILTAEDDRWNVRLFRVGADRKLWHAIHSQTHRFSLGYLIRRETRWEKAIRRLARAAARARKGLRRSARDGG